MVEKIQNNPFNRPPRIQDVFKPEELDIPAPPSKPDEPSRNILLMLLPMGSFLIMGLFYSLAFSANSGGLGWLYVLPMLGMAAFTFIASFVMYGEQKYEQKQRWIKQLRDYHRLLDKKETRLLSGRVLQQNLLKKRFPDSALLIKRARNLEITLWERRFEDSDFLAFRLGIGELASSIRVKSPDPDNNSPEIRRAFGIYSNYRNLPNVPVAIDLKDLGSVALVGNRDSVLSLSRALFTQLASLNSPDDVNLYVFSSQPHYHTWKWLRWLPHTSEENTGGHPSYMAFTRESNRRLITEISKRFDSMRGGEEQDQKKASSITPPVIIALFDDEIDIRDEQIFHEILKNGNKLGIYSILICDRLEDVPSNCQSLIEFPEEDKFRFSKTGMDGIKLYGTPDKIGLVDAENLAYRLIPVAIRTLGKNSRIPTRLNLLQTYQANRIEDINIEELWGRLPRRDGLLPFPVYVGSETYVVPLVLDLAENEHGPHGIIAGTTGSGKSELLQTLISSLALEHHPYYVNFLLIDFKGGSTFGIFENLPHVVGLVSNLDKRSAMRALEAIKAENLRRQHFLKKYNLEDIGEYHERLTRTRGLSPEWEPLPHLFIVVDEFAQLAHNMPNFLPELVSIGQVGRSLGIHLILATQRPGGVVTDEMRANLNFRISLRVQTIDDSRDLLRRPDAAYLPHNLPGRAYFQLGDGGTPRQFQVARAGIAYEAEYPLDAKKPIEVYKLNYEETVLTENFDQTDLSAKDENEKDRDPTIAFALASVLKNKYDNYLQDGYLQPNKILLPQLPTDLEITSLLENTEFAWDEKKDAKKIDAIRFGAPVGQIDDLARREQPLFFVDFLNYGGHVMAIGGPQSGKTNFLKTLAYSISINYLPEDVFIYALSFAGRELEVIKELPHVGAVIQGSESERFHRLIRFLQLEIETRKELFNTLGSKDLPDYNRRAQEGKPFIVVLVENFGELRNPEYSDEIADIERLIQIGRNYGIHFILTALQGSDIPYKIANLIQQRIAFNLADHTEYLTLVGRPDSLEFDALPPGRCFISGSNPPLQCQIGLAPDKDEWGNLASKMSSPREHDKKVRPVPIGILETKIFLSEHLDQTEHLSANDHFVIGVDGDTLLPFVFNWKKYGSHLLIGGPSQSGRTSLLHSFALSLASVKSPQDLWMVLMDGSNGSLHRLADLPHVIDWINEEDGLAKNIAHLQKELTYRREQRLRDAQSNFPEILFLIDDYDLTCEALALNDVILTKLGKLIRQDTDLGFHFLIAGLTDNLSGDPLIRQLRLGRSGISLVNTDTLELLGGRSTSAMRNQELPQGRGYLLSRSGYRLVQFGFPDDNAYSSLFKKWKKMPKVAWKQIATEEEIQQVRDESAPAQGRFTYDMPHSKSGGFIDMDEALKRYMKQQQMLKKGQ